MEAWLFGRRRRKDSRREFRQSFNPDLDVALRFLPNPRCGVAKCYLYVISV